MVVIDERLLCKQPKEPTPPKNRFTARFGLFSQGNYPSTPATTYLLSLHDTRLLSCLAHNDITIVAAAEKIEISERISLVITPSSLSLEFR